MQNYQHGQVGTASLEGLEVNLTQQVARTCMQVFIYYGAWG